MSLGQHQLNTIRHMSEQLDWVSAIESFGAQHDMKFLETLRWISNRTSLQVACEVLGVALSPSIAARYTSTDLHILNSLGDILWTYGFEVPRLMEHRRMAYVRKGQESMGFSLSREEYLLERAQGKSKNKIAHQQGISGPALFHWLNKWGLKDATVEQREIEALLGGRREGHTDNPSLTNATASNAPYETANKVPHETVDKTIEAVDETTNTTAHETAHPASTSTSAASMTRSEEAASAASYVFYPSRKLHLLSGSGLPVTKIPSGDSEGGRSSGGAINGSHLQVRIPSSSDARIIGTIQLPVVTPVDGNQLQDVEDVGSLSRDELMQTGLQMIQHALAQAYTDLAALLGESAAREQIQQYVIHQIENFIQNA